MPQVSQILLSNQNPAFPLRLVDVLSENKAYVQCPADMTRHTETFVAALEYTGQGRCHSHHSASCCDGVH